MLRGGSKTPATCKMEPLFSNGYLLEAIYYYSKYLFPLVDVAGVPDQPLTTIYYFIMGVVYATIRNPTFCLALYLTGIHFRGKLQYVGHVGAQKIKS